MGLFDIYSKENRRIIMAKKIDGMDKITDATPSHLPIVALLCPNIA